MTDTPPPAAATATLGDTVAYRSRRSPYWLAAIVTATVDTLWDEGVAAGHVPALSSPSHVHLHVLTPGADGSYQEHDVPYSAGGEGGTWRSVTSTRVGAR